MIFKVKNFDGEGLLLATVNMPLPRWQPERRMDDTGRFGKVDRWGDDVIGLLGDLRE